MSEAPERIWLQWVGPYGENTFCEDQINSNDVEYICADLHQEDRDRIEELESQAEWMEGIITRERKENAELKAEVELLKKKEAEEMLWLENRIEELESEFERLRQEGEE